MVDKRPAAEAAAGDAKRTKGADAIAAAKAKAAEIAARLAARKAAPNGAPAAPVPAPAAAAGDTQDRLAALKARMAAMKAGSAPAKPTTPDSSAPRFATTLGNRRAETPVADTRAAPAAPKPKEQTDEESFNPYFDPKAASQPGARTRVSKPLQFNEHGKYLDQASKLRGQGRLEQIK